MLKHEERLEGVDNGLASVVRLVGQEIDVEVICGLRTQAEQDVLFAAGKSKNKISKHTSGRAVDLCLLVNGEESWKVDARWHAMLDLVQLAGKDLGVIVRYGHTWTTNPDDKPARFDDAGHIELPGDG